MSKKSNTLASMMVRNLRRPWKQVRGKYVYPKVKKAQSDRTAGGGVKNVDDYSKKLLT